jgi:RNA polymerase sigma-70 factor (ECF subfamily)
MIISTAFCNIFACRAIVLPAMVGVMAKIVEQTDDDGLVLRAHTEADALGRLYELYYERIYRFCVHRLFSQNIAEDVTSSVFLNVARGIRDFKGRTQQDFRNWLYAIAANQTNAHIRKASRRQKLLEKAAASIAASRGNSTDHLSELDWPTIYAAILKLKPEHQTIVTLRFFENLEFEEIGQIMSIRPATIRVTLHRILMRLRNHLQTVLNGEG